MKFLKLHDKSEAFIHYQKKITQKMGPLVSNGWGQERTGGGGDNDFFHHGYAQVGRASSCSCRKADATCLY